MQKISCEKAIYVMDQNNPPVLKTRSGERLLFQTCDCFEGQITSESQSIDALNWDHVNPATGPVYVEEAQPGDTMKVTIHSISFTGPGVMAAIPDVGVFGESVKSSRILVMQAENGQVRFNKDIVLPQNAMIGVIGTAPQGEGIPCGTPGDHGGNMDCKEIGAGTVLYLPVFVPGALLAMGDVHAAMGDGEIMGTGVEIPAEIEVSVEVQKGRKLAVPLLETKEQLYAIASAATLEQAGRRAANVMRDILMEKRGLSGEEAGMLMSAAGQMQVCQVVDPLLTMRFGLPHYLLESK